ncbi:MAG: hypothetical protein MZV63_12000 [Marinilabiliales bacterium]|nr:hypothetical protein [Marinilabiliales bacterium]
MGYLTRFNGERPERELQRISCQLCGTVKEASYFTIITAKASVDIRFYVLPEDLFSPHITQCLANN